MHEQQYHSQDEQQNCLGDGDTQQKIPPPIDNSSSGETNVLPGETKTARRYDRQPHQLLDAVWQDRARKEDYQHGDGESCRVHKSDRHRDDNNNKPERREKKDDEDRISSSDEIVQKNNVRRGLRDESNLTLVRTSPAKIIMMNN
eukprot:scaffold6079_cov73-Skeletonema_dohrnii-CCMP3373.AAC.2